MTNPAHVFLSFSFYPPKHIRQKNQYELRKVPNYHLKIFELKLRVLRIWKNSQKVDYVAGVVLKVFPDILTLFFSLSCENIT